MLRVNGNKLLRSPELTKDLCRSSIYDAANVLGKRAGQDKFGKASDGLTEAQGRHMIISVYKDVTIHY
jgi:hypothetical protein